ncbi:DUF805 domain-containing protein [Brevundimonas sp.]
MRGEVISVDSFSGHGLISGEDAGRYSFAASATRTALRIGDKVDFVGTNGVATDIIALSAPISGIGVAEYGYSRPSAGTGYNFLSAVFSFNGRLRRSHFWISWAIMCATWLVTFWMPLLNVVFYFVLLWTNLAVGAKRFHDMGKTGWLIAIPWTALILVQVITLGGVGYSYINDPQSLASDGPTALLIVIGLLAIIAVPLSLGFWLWLGIADSQPGRNKYGPNPKNPVDDTANTFS